MMNEKEQFKIYEKLMFKALENPNEINFVCMQVIVSLAHMAGKNEKEFKSLLDDMEELFKGLNEFEDIMKSLVLKALMEMNLEN